MKKYIVGNWKMNNSLAEIDKFIQDLVPEEISKHLETWVAPQFIHISHMREKLPQGYQVGGQNLSEHAKGPWTGEVSASSLKDLGAHFVLVGHSERRQHFQEVSFSKKIKIALENNLVPIYCIGETLEERKSGKTEAVLQKQLSELAGLELDSVILAYEPVWAIGTGVTATNQEIQAVCSFLSDSLEKKLPILYGGSVKTHNCVEILKIPHVSGVLVGGASLKGSDYQKLCTGHDQ